MSLYGASQVVHILLVLKEPLSEMNLALIVDLQMQLPVLLVSLV